MATLSVYSMRCLIADVYSSQTWKERVKHMSDDQVIAVYYSFCEKGKFNRFQGILPKPHKNEEVKERECVPVNDSYFESDTAEQLSFEF